MKKSEEKILLALWKEQPQNIIKLSKTTDMIRGWVSKGVTVLLEQKFIVEQEAKGRSKPYKLTDTGTQYATYLVQLRELEKK